jgi:hypothetical protein
MAGDLLERLTMSDELRGVRCAWAECRKTFEGDMSAEWVWLLAYWSRRPQVGLDSPDVKWMRDAASREHARVLDSMLKPMPPRELLGKA